MISKLGAWSSPDIVQRTHVEGRGRAYVASAASVQFLYMVASRITAHFPELAAKQFADGHQGLTGYGS